MDALDIGRVLRRRWKLSAAIAAVLLVLLAGILFLVPQQYRTTAISLVTPVGSSTVQNPYAVADKSQSQLAALLVTVLSADQTQEELSAAGAVGTIQVTNGNGAADTTQTDSPFITFTVTSPTAADATHAAQLVRQRAVDELQHRQQDARVDPSQWLTLTEVLPAADPVTTRASQLRALGLTAALGLVVGVLGVIIADRVLIARETKSRLQDSDGPTKRLSPVSTGEKNAETLA